MTYSLNVITAVPKVAPPQTGIIVPAISLQRRGSAATVARRSLDPSYSSFRVRMVDISTRDPRISAALSERLDFGSAALPERRLSLSDAQAVLTPQELARFSVIADGLSDLQYAKSSSNRLLGSSIAFGLIGYAGFLLCAPDVITALVVAALGGGTLGLGVHTALQVGGQRDSARSQKITADLSALQQSP